ncbi:MAG: alpha/beta fold hydrolase [Candidatus Margulisiibacteriota bacterium]
MKIRLKECYNVNMKKLLFFLIFPVIWASAAFAFDLPGLPWGIPQDIKPKTLNKYIVENIVVEEINYTCSNYGGNDVNIFGFLCYPLAKKELPAVIVVHGGGGYAYLERSLVWARLGYASLCIDLPGKGIGRSISRSTGPDMTVENLFKSSPGLTDNYLYHAVKAARGAITFLSGRENIDRDKIGMVGLSWGGVITLITNGLDQRLAAAIPVFGSGYLTEGSTWQEYLDSKLPEKERKSFQEHFDPSNFLRYQHAPVYYVTGTNDNCFYLPNFIRSYLMIPANKKMYIYPNIRHMVNEDMFQNIIKYCDSRLKGANDLPDIFVKPIEEDATNIYIPIKTSGRDPTKRVDLYYCGPDLRGWTKKKWESREAYFSRGTQWVKFAREEISPEIIFYASATDIKGASVSSPLYSIMRFRVNDQRDVFVTSLPIDKINYHYLDRNSLEKILNGPVQSRNDRIPLRFFWDIGGKLSVDKAFNLTLP